MTEAFPISYQHQHYLLLHFLTSFNHKYYLHMAKLHEIYTGIAHGHRFVTYFSQDTVSYKPHLHLVLPTDYSEWHFPT